MGSVRTEVRSGEGGALSPGGVFEGVVLGCAASRGRRSRRATLCVGIVRRTADGGGHDAADAVDGSSSCWWAEALRRASSVAECRARSFGADCAPDVGMPMAWMSRQEVVFAALGEGREQGFRRTCGEAFEVDEVVDV